MTTTTTTTTTRRMSRRDREYVGAGAVELYRAVGPRGLVAEMEDKIGRPLDAEELAVVQEAVEAADPGMDWDAPWHAIAGRFPAAVR